MGSDRPYIPALLAFLSAALWGLWWIPIRYLENQGLDGAWGSIAMNTGAFLIALIWMLARRTPGRLGWRAMLGAALVGVAVSTYSVAITMGDVVRLILLFYLAPAWSKILEWAFMGRHWGLSSTLTILASLAGAFLVLGGQISLSVLGAADVLALISGVAWALGAMFIFTGGRTSPVGLTCISALSATTIGLSFVLLGQGSALSGATNWAGSLTGAGFGVIYVLPVLAITLWAAQQLSPAVITFLLTAEILAGVISGALYLDEPFGLMQAGGTCLILLAAMAEVLAGLRPGRHTAPYA